MKKVTKTNKKPVSKKSAVRRKDVRRPVVKNTAKKVVAPTPAPKTPHTVTTTVTTTTTITPVAAAPAPVARKTLVSFIIDESGSMADNKQVTISGFNEYLQTLKANGGDILFTLTKFSNNSSHVVHKSLPLAHVPKLDHFNYTPSGGTPLYDAIGHTIASIDHELVNVVEKPAVMLVIMTDGEENASREFTRESIFALIKAKEALGWGFIYLGANQDAYKAAGSFGISASNTSNYHVSNTLGAFAGVANATAVYTKSVSRGMSVDNLSMISEADRSVIESKTANVHTGNIPLSGGAKVGDVVVGSVSSAPLDGATLHSRTNAVDADPVVLTTTTRGTN